MTRLHWLHVKPINLAVMVAPKCGAQTVFAAIGAALGHDLTVPSRIKTRHFPDVELLSSEAVRRLSVTKVAVVRDPVSRFKSLWKNKCRDRTKGIPAHLYGATPSELLSVIERDVYGNHHWFPQASIEDDVADKLVPIECFSRWWKHGPVKVWNKTSGDCDCDEARVRRLYERDVRLYQRAVMEAA